MNVVNIGILGGGQLAQMLALAAVPLGIKVHCFDANPNACAGLVAPLTVADFTDTAALQAFIRDKDCITFETENVPAVALAAIAHATTIYPSPTVISLTQDRLQEKTLCRTLGIPTANFLSIDSIDDLHPALQQIGFPALLKTRRGGYDGKGQLVLKTAPDIDKARAFCAANPSCILEQWVPFQKEYSLIAARSHTGHCIFYPLTHNIHEHGILKYAIAPATVTAHVQQTAEIIAQKLLEALNYIGVLVVELFDTGTHLLVNELAPRVHNSGHWTIEGASHSQFEQHLRAITGLPLAQPQVFGASVLLNCIGEMPPAAHVLQFPYTHYHAYGKEPRSGRKVGHITVHAPTQDAATRILFDLLQPAASV